MGWEMGLGLFPGVGGRRNVFDGSTNPTGIGVVQQMAVCGEEPECLCGAGLFSTAMRDLANITHDGPKWIILDGDIDPMWIESLNTVMDDNKVGAITPQGLSPLLVSGGPAPDIPHNEPLPQVLTLASNERIPLTPTMRLIFEISHLRTDTPATVSRAGILYINPTDLGWNP